MFDVLARLAARRGGARGSDPARPAEAPDHFGRGLGALSDGRPGDALAAFEAALLEAADDVERARIHNKRGVAFVAQGHAARAREAFQAALEARPAFAPALVNLGNLALEEGSPADAIGFYERAILADPEYGTAYFNLGIACKRSGRRAEAVRHFRTAMRLEVRAGRPER
jgi:tetratricopeptide (TPR) repeat protein